MSSERSTSTMKSEPGRSISLSTPAPVLFGAGFFSPVAACAVTVVAASVAAAPFRNVRREFFSMELSSSSQIRLILREEDKNETAALHRRRDVCGLRPRANLAIEADPRDGAFSAG